MCTDVFLAYMYMCKPQVCSAHGQKRVLDPLDLELQIVMNHHMCAGNYTQVLCKSNKRD